MKELHHFVEKSKCTLESPLFSWIACIKKFKIR